MQAITTIGLDIAKSVFQVHGVDAEASVVIRRHVKRREVPMRAPDMMRILIVFLYGLLTNELIVEQTAYTAGCPVVTNRMPTIRLEAPES